MTSLTKKSLDDVGAECRKDQGPHTFTSSLCRNRWLTSTLIVTLFVALCYSLVGLPYFETNDDVVMAAIVSGAGYVDRPDEHALFGNLYIGLLLKQLYSLIPAIPWYGLFQTATIIVAMTSITWLILGKSRRPTMMLGIAFGALLVTSIRPLLLMQFTTSGALLACAGALLLIECVERWHLRKRAIACGIAGTVMFALAALVRTQSAELVLAVMIIFTVARFLPSPVRQWHKMLAQLLVLSAALAFVQSLWLISEHYYQGEWKDSFKARCPTNVIREYGCHQLNSPLRQSIYKSVGWTSTDSTLFINWYGLDKNTYSVDKLNALSKTIKQHWLATFDIGKVISAMQSLLTNPMFLPLVLPSVLLIPFVNRAKVPYLSWLLVSIGVLSLCAYSIVWMKLPMRVLASILMTLTLLAIRYVSMSKIAAIFQSETVFTNKESTRADAEQISTRGAGNTIYGIVLLAAIVPGFWLMSLLHVHLKTAATQEGKLNEAIRSLSPKPDQLYVCWAANPRVVISPFTDLNKLYHNFNIIPVGAIGPAPFITDRLRKFGIDNPLRHLDRDNVFLISNDEYNRFIRMYAAEKLGKEVVFTPLPVKPKVFKAFKVKYVTPADPEKLKRDLNAAFLN